MCAFVCVCLGVRVCMCASVCVNGSALASELECCAHYE